MLKDNWEEKHGINLPIHTTWSNGVQGTHPGNMILRTFQGFPDNDHLAGSTSGYSIPQQSNLQDGRSGLFINQPTSIEPLSFRHQFDNQFHHQNHLTETQPTFIANTCGNGIEKIGSASHKMASQSSLLVKNMLVEETHKPCSQIVNRAEQTLVDANLKELIKILSANYGPMKKPLEMGTPEYMKLVEILQQSSVQPKGFSDQLNGRGYYLEELSKQSGSYSKGGGTNTTPSGEIASLAPSASTEQDEKKLPSEKAPHVAAEKLWDGSLQLSSSVTLYAVAFFKSGEKLVGNNWPEFIEVKGKVRLEAFEKYVQDLPCSRNRGLMVTSICWNEESSNIGLNGMKEVAKGYKKSSRVGFAHLLSGIDLYICPRSDQIITILAKYGFFKGMSVIDDKPDSMIGCVVWRKNRPLNTSDGKNIPNSKNSPPGFSKQGSKKKHFPESSQHDEPLTLLLTTNIECSKNITATAVDHNGVSSSSSSTSLQNSLRKRSFEDDDLPEFDFGVGSGKPTLVSKPLVNYQKLDNSLLTQLPFEQSCTKKTKLFDDDDDDDMPEWRPPELHNQLQSQTTTSDFQKLPLYTPRPPPPPPPPVPPPPRSDTHSSFSYQPFRPGISSPSPTFLRPPTPPTFLRPPLPPLPPPPLRPQQLPSSSLPMFNSNQALWRHPGSFIANPQFPPSSRRHF